MDAIQVKPHRIRWYGQPGMVPRSPYMAGRDWGWDATCLCGWRSATGGAIQARVRELVQDHLYFEHGVKTGPWRVMP